MKQSELKKVVDFYNQVIQKQIIKPVEINEIFNLIHPERSVQVPYFQKMRAITVYVQSLQQQVLDGLEDMFNEFDEEQKELEETNDPRLSTYIPKDSAASPNTVDDTQSHKEDVNYHQQSDESQLKEKFNYSDEDLTVNTQYEHAQKEIEELQKQYEDAETNVKRSITARINAIKKRMNDA
jgi:hypothetical protein